MDLPAVSIFRLLCLFVFVMLSHAFADDQTANSCSYNDVSGAISTSISTGGGIVSIPACSESDWGNNYVTIDTDTPIKITGSGIDTTNFACSANAMFIIRGDGLAEIGGFSVDLKNTGNIIISLNSPEKTTNTLVHDIKALNSDSSPFKICHSAFAKNRPVTP